ncbi:uncharacterized protein BCR38DRAFT_333798 [Pseudomassariella vexata]|uniref:PHD and RING finger domain-containing protein n=1 Tax=Pseudomassariella vexata TaxID=1141098 RepID=A0A1Y2EDD2_9PEZI|nr:uncharacterized protein BCR38DRAFT_333798 [Pseudomassariella vexata]ORY69593.1 hypothetical protein BCR38DRAFT_333798 [Pseudomassariella vexata]
MADQCIVCLENLDVQQLPLRLKDKLHLDGSPSTSHPKPTGAVPLALKSTSDDFSSTTTSDEDSKVAEIQVCGHILHNTCLREWTGKANSCPICRQTFHLVHVYDKVGGTKLSTYTVEDKKQVAEFDPQAWLDENPEEEEPVRSCPICERSDNEEVLLLCDSCDAPYHTHCVGLDSVPRGHWYCLECADDAAELLAAELADPAAAAYGLAGASDSQSDYLPRTQATMRRARNRARSDEWQGAWGQIARHIFDVLNLDLDNHDDDESLQNYRRSQQRRERERREYERWQQRLRIASRFGTQDVFVNNLPRVLPQPLQQQPLPPPQETPEEKLAWSALEKAMEANNSSGATPNSRKRKSRSVTTSPREPPQEPERKLKRPRTRRVPNQSESSTSGTNQPQQNGLPSPTHTGPNGSGPSFLSSLLKEVETSAPSDDENVRGLFRTSKPPAESLSPVTSPSASGYSSPRALSTTPPPRTMNERPGSPLSLMSRIEPIYPPANFSPNRNGVDQSGSDSTPRHHNHHHRNGPHSPEIRQPRPQRRPVNINTEQMSSSPDTSPTRGSLPFETKESISNIIKTALTPHYKSGNITPDQYTAINRDLSRKMYRDISEGVFNEDARRRCEKMATKEVDKAVAKVRNIQV